MGIWQVIRFGFTIRFPVLLPYFWDKRFQLCRNSTIYPNIRNLLDSFQNPWLFASIFVVFCPFSLFYKLFDNSTQWLILMKRKGKKICIWVLRYKNCIWIHKLYFVFGYKIQNLGWVPLVVSVWVLFCICILYLRFLYFVFCIFRTQVKKGSEPGFFYFFEL